MTSNLVYDDQRKLIADWLERAEQGNLLGGSKRRYALLKYLVNEELEGRGDALKAYAIALDVLGRHEDFDPSTDSIVRVEVARLRDALELYYARSANDAEPVIEIPKGGYRPMFTVHPPVLERAPKQRGGWNLNYLLMAAVAAAIILAVSVTRFVGTGQPKYRGDQPPIVEVARLELANPSDEDYFAIGFRQQLLTDLAHLPTIIVRDGPLSENAIGRGDVRPPNYRLKIVSARQDNGGIVSLRLTSEADETVVWAKTVEIATESATFYESIENTVLGIGQEIAGPTGAITLQQGRYSVDAAKRNSVATTSEYRCLVISLIYDATKEADAGTLSEACLTKAVSEDTQNATLLAQHALNLFFKSAGATEKAESVALIKEAELQARKAVAINPQDSLAHEILGNVLSTSQNPAAAIAEYSRAVELAPSRPAPHFLLGWQQVLQGDWEQGMDAVQVGISMHSDAPGYMIIPLALDAFRRSDYELSLSRAQAVIERGDPRGYALAFAASVALKDTISAQAYFSDPKARTSTNPIDPMREVRLTFSNPDVMEKYDQIIKQHFTQ